MATVASALSKLRAQTLSLSLQEQRWWENGEPVRGVNTFRSGSNRRSSGTEIASNFRRFGILLAISLAGGGVTSAVALRVFEEPQERSEPLVFEAEASSLNHLPQDIVDPVAAHDARANPGASVMEYLEETAGETGIADDGAEPAEPAKDADEAETPPVSESERKREETPPDFEEPESATLLDLPPVPVDEAALFESAQPPPETEAGIILPEMEDTLAMRIPGLMSVKEILDEPKKVSASQLLRYRKEFPEIFVSTPAPESRSDLANRGVASLEAREVARRARNWRDLPQPAEQARKPRLLQKLGNLLHRKG